MRVLDSDIVNLIPIFYQPASDRNDCAFDAVHAGGLAPTSPLPKRIIVPP